MRDLNGKTAFITGGASGIGLGMATAFARAGMNVTITDIQKDQLEIAERELKAITDNVLALEVDSTDKQSLEDAADKLEGAFGKLEDRAIAPATKKLHAFANQVNAFVRVGILPAEEAELLLVGAMGVIDQP